MSSCSELNDARKKLDESLGDNKKQYFQLLKQWFQMKYTREQFYIESRKLLSGDQIRLHNAFLLNLFNTCQFPTSSENVPVIAKKPASASREKDQDKDKDKEKDKSRKSKSRKRTRSDRGNFEYADSMDYLPVLHPLPSQARDEPIRYCHQELFLPDTSHMRGRLLIAAWENGMEGASEQEAEYLVIAVQYFLKNILTSIFSQRSGYKVREGRFQYCIGCSVPNPMLQNATKTLSHDNLATEIDEDSESIQVPKVKRSIEEIEQQAIFEIASTKPRRTVKAPVSAFDLLEALQTDRKRIPIPSHIVYSVNVARIIARLNHPTREELEAGREKQTCLA